MNAHTALAALAGNYGHGDIVASHRHDEGQLVYAINGVMLVSVEETTDGRGQRQYALVMSDAVSTGLAARGGKAQRTLRNQFGVSRPGVVRP